MTNRTHKDEVTFEEKFNDYGEYENNTGEDYSISSIDTAPNYDDYEYEKEDDGTWDLVKRLSIAVVAIIIIIILILLLLKACTGTPGTKPTKLITGPGWRRNWSVPIPPWARRIATPQRPAR